MAKKQQPIFAGVYWVNVTYVDGLGREHSELASFALDIHLAHNSPRDCWGIQESEDTQTNIESMVVSNISIMLAGALKKEQYKIDAYFLDCFHRKIKPNAVSI